ncbi:MAG: ATP-binding cassette domain-containing protein [Pelagibacteraceae bacterium TMED124]|nr:ABC transporter permease [Rickettsiales bacterium]RPG19524.1 MAG: ATP-binding cassette domain-containing protein [Pelagibacteraceae bacterium TMED124]
MNVKVSTKQILIRLFNSYVKKHYVKIFISVFCMVLIAAATATNAWLMQPVLDDIFIKKNKNLIIIIPAVILLIAFVKGTASYFQSVLMSFVGYKIVADVQKHMLTTLLKCDLSYFNITNSGTLVSRFLADVGALSRGVHNVIINIVKDSLTFIFLLGVMFHHDTKLATITLLIFPLAIYPISRIGKRLRKISKNTQVGFGLLTKKLTESFQGIKTIKSFNAEKVETSKIEKEIENLFFLTLKSTKVNSISRPLMETLGGLAVALIVYVGGTQVIGGETTPGTFFSFLTALLMAYQPLKSLATLNATLQISMASAERIFEIIDQKPIVIEKNPDKDFLLKTGYPYDLKIKKVDFKYDNSPNQILKNIDLEITKGQKVALVGHSGAGKTSLLNLIPRFFDVEKGHIFLGEVDIRDLSFKFLRDHFSIVSQDVILFDETIKTNIAYGKQKASLQEIKTACEKANCNEFIDNLPNKLNEYVGEKGVKLSGGQKQRVAIARAFLKNSPFLLLDEATSSLDSKSERKIQVSLSKLMKNKTSLVIAHRLSTILDADKIVLLHKGKVEAVGKHNFLLKSSKIYKNLYELQFKEKK